LETANRTTLLPAPTLLTFWLKRAINNRALSVAFLKPVRGEDVLGKAITEIETKRANMDKVYGKCAEALMTMNAETGAGSLMELLLL
jgi:hypothetical protein